MSDRPRPLDTLDPPRNFTITTEQRVRAMSIGVPAYAARKREIEDKDEAVVAALVRLHDKLLAKGASAEIALHALAAKASELDLAKVNRLVEKHNVYYPIEANLSIDPATGGYLLLGRPWQAETPRTGEIYAKLARARIAAGKR